MVLCLVRGLQFDRWFSLWGQTEVMFCKRVELQSQVCREFFSGYEAGQMHLTRSKTQRHVETKTLLSVKDRRELSSTLCPDPETDTLTRQEFLGCLSSVVCADLIFMSVSL